MLSAARAELFELFEEVTARDGTKVIIAHRTSPKKAVLVSEDYLDRLERAVRAPSVSSFKLFGSMELCASPDDPLESTLREQTTLAEKKLRAFDAPRRNKKL